MQKFLQRSSFFLIVFIALSVAIGNILPLKKYWGNEQYQLKIEGFRNGNYNTTFFGSSRILTGVDPKYFDSLVSDIGVNIKSYNLATAGTWSNETFYLYEEFLEDSSLSSGIDIVFMEFQNIMAIQFDKISTPKVIYYQSMKNTSFIADFAKEEVKKGSGKIPLSLSLVGLYSLAMIQEGLNVGKSKLFFPGIADSEHNKFDSYGYLKLERTTEKNINRALDGYISSIQANLTKKNLEPNLAFQNKLLALIKESHASGIKLVFVLPPVRLTPSMAAVFSSLPPENKIQLCDPLTFNQLYLSDNWADRTHFNSNGSRKFSEYFAQQFRRTHGPMSALDSIQ